MGRPKNGKHSSDIDAEIRRLEEEKQRLIIAEDQRRGAIIRECLSGKAGDRLCEILRPLVAPRDAFLFGLEPLPSSRMTAAPVAGSDLLGRDAIRTRP